jgi:hypothetical protein
MEEQFSLTGSCPDSGTANWPDAGTNSRGTGFQFRSLTPLRLIHKLAAVYFKSRKCKTNSEVF